jgi:sarcosine oxidase subunit beta
MSNKIIIVGAGIIGNATAYYLAKKGYSVTVLEKSPYIGNGGSSRNGGGVRQSGRHPAELPLAMYGVQNLWPNLSEELGMDVEYYKQGNLRLGKTDAHLDILKGLTDRCVAGGLTEMRMVDYKEAKEICPYLSDEVIGAGWCPTDGHANPMLATLAFYRAARKLGVEFVSGIEATALLKVRGRVSKVVTNDGIYEGDSVVVCAGYASRKLLASVGLDVPVSNMLMECIVTEESPPLFYQMLGTAMADFYGHQSKHGSFVFGGTHGYEAYSKDDGTPISSSIGTSSTSRGIIGYFPVLKDLKIVRSWGGWIDDCADHIPVIDTPAETPGLTIGCAFSGHGFGISPVVGTIIASLAVEEEPILPVSAFRYDRFKAKV